MIKKSLFFLNLLLQSHILMHRVCYTTSFFQKEEEFVFSEVYEKPVPSLLRGFSAPVRLETDLSDNDIFFLLAHDSDEFNRYINIFLCIVYDKINEFHFTAILHYGLWIMDYAAVGRPDRFWPES